MAARTYTTRKPGLLLGRKEKFFIYMFVIVVSLVAMIIA